MRARDGITEVMVKGRQAWKGFVLVEPGEADLPI